MEQSRATCRRKVALLRRAVAELRKIAEAAPDLSDELSAMAAEIEDAADNAERRLNARFPATRSVQPN